MTFPADRPNLKFEVNFEDDPLQAHPAYLESLTAPLGWWKLNERSGSTAIDYSGNSRDGTYNGVTLAAGSGPFGSYEALEVTPSFDGTNDYINLAASTTWQNLTAAWTIMAWIYPTATRDTATTAFAGIIGQALNHTFNHSFFMHYGDGSAYAGGMNTNATPTADQIWCGWLSGGILVHVTSPSSVTLNTWQHYATVWDGDILTMYRNGVSIATYNPSGTPSASSSNVDVRIGTRTHDPAGATPYFPGHMSDVAIFDYALRADQIANLQNYHTVRPVTEANYIDLSAAVDLNASRVRSAPIRRGRSDSVSRVEAGRGTLILGNRDGVLNPDPVVNLLVNPGAELSTVGLPFTAEGGTLSRDIGASIANHGNWVWGLFGQTGGSIAYATTQRDGLVGMRPGKTYTFSAYIYCHSGIGLALNEVHVEIVDTIAGSPDSQDTQLSAFDAWTRISVTKTIRDAADAAYVRARIISGSPSEYILIDNVQLEEAASASTYCDGDRTDCSWGGEPHASLSHRKQASAPARKIGMPMRRFRLTAEWDGTDYGLLHGYVERWDWVFPSQGKDAYAVARLVDGTRILASRSMRGFSRSSERVGDRIRAILAHAGIGDADMDVNDEFITTTAVSAQATVADDRSAISMIRDLEETERGVFFVSKDGLFTYQGSLYRSIEGREDLIITDTTDDTDQARYSDISISTDISGVVNDENIENIQNNTDFRRLYALSQQRYFPVASSESSLWQTNTVSYFDRSVPLPYAEGIEIRPYRDPDNLWPAILGVELGALVRVERTHQGVDLAAGELHFLEGIEHDINPGNWTTRLRTAPTPRAPVSADPWQTPIAKPIYLTNVFSGSGGSSVVIPSRLWTAGKLYLVFAYLGANGGTAPVQPTFSGSNTWASIRADTGVSTVSWRHQTFSCLATATATEAVTLSFAGQTPNNLYDVVLLEISDGFQAGTPIADSNQSTTVSAYAGYVDVGTLTDAESIILAGVWKNANADTNWSGGVELYDRASNNLAYSVAYGYPPGVDRIDFSWGQANGFHGTGFEVEAS